MPDGIITRFAGIGVGGYNGDGSPLSKRHCSIPSTLHSTRPTSSTSATTATIASGWIDNAAADPTRFWVIHFRSRSTANVSLLHRDGGPARRSSDYDARFDVRSTGRDDLYVGEKIRIPGPPVDAATGIVRPPWSEPACPASAPTATLESAAASIRARWDSGRTRRHGVLVRLQRPPAPGRSPDPRRDHGAGGNIRGGRRPGPAPRSSPRPARLAVARRHHLFCRFWNHRVRAIAPDRTSVRRRERRAPLRRRRRPGHRGPPRKSLHGRSGCRRESLHRRPAPGPCPAGRPLGTITAYVGNGFARDHGDGGPANSTPKSLRRARSRSDRTRPSSSETSLVAFGASTPATGRIETFVGTGILGYPGDGGPATQARFRQPAAIAFDREGSLLFADSGSHCVRRSTGGDHHDRGRDRRSWLLRRRHAGDRGAARFPLGRCGRCPRSHLHRGGRESPNPARRAQRRARDDRRQRGGRRRR